MITDLSGHPDFAAGPQALHGVIRGNPWSKRRPRISAGGRRTHQDPDDAAAEGRTRRALIERNWPMLTGNLWLRATFYRDSRQVVDLDNLEKHLLDCGNNVLWVDDCQVTEKHTCLRLDRFNPRTEYWVGPALTDAHALARDLSGERYEKAQAILARWKADLR